MKKGPKTYAEQVRQPLLDLWRGQPGYGRSVGCVATTFTFDAGFFEEHCLARFIGMECSPEESARAYYIEREEKLSQTFACVLVDSSQAKPDRSLRWHQLPIALKGGGVQHAKLTLLAWEHHIRVMIGSANLTEPAYRRNLELVAVLDFHPEGEVEHGLLKDCVSFIRQLARFAPGADIEGGPHSRLREFLDHVERRVDHWPAKTDPEAQCFLVPLMRNSGAGSVLRQLNERWRRPAPNEAWVVSPFFDEGPDAASTAGKLAELLTTRGHRLINFCGIGRMLPNGAVQLEMPSELRKPSHRSLAHAFRFIPDEEVLENEAKIRRPLHAKAIWLQRDERALYMIGSSNFTRAGLGLHERHNIELNIAYLIRDINSRFGKLCEASWPSGPDVEDPPEVDFLGGPSSSQDMADSTSRLHPAFGAALLRVEDDIKTIELEIAANAPDTFEILDKEGGLLASSHSWAESRKPFMLRLEWKQTRLPSALRARWQQGDEWIEAPWIVNVFDTSMLPAIEELAELTLDELMSVITSTLPLHRVVLRTLEARAAKAALTKEIETDPHKRVSTSHHLLKRMRRASDAFEGIRRRLSEPVHSMESLRWRLHGPLGPIVFAKKLAAAEGNAAGFLMAELASTLRQVNWQPAGTLKAKGLREAVDQVIAELKEMAESIPAPENLASYIRETFREAGQ
ncbi:MAG: hypothetical protein IRZ28_12320 [Steroidobacteraceae bacterium]|nr:hypothetical protein [Steroidobacteraceae bacterium]